MKKSSKVSSLTRIALFVFVIQFFIGCDYKSVLSEIQTLIKVDRAVLGTYHEIEMMGEAVDNNYYSSFIYMGDVNRFSEPVTEEAEIKKLISDSMFSKFAYWSPTDEEKVKYSEMMYKKIKWNDVKFYKYTAVNENELHSGAPYKNWLLLELASTASVAAPSTIMIITDGDLENSKLYGVFSSDVWD